MIPVRVGGQSKAIVFVHGLNSNPRDLWRAFQSTIRNDDALARWDILSFRYGSTTLSLTGIGQTYEGLARSLYHELSVGLPAEYEQLEFVTHGEGGLVVQVALLDRSDLAARAHHVFLFAAPTAGLRLFSLQPWKAMARISDALGSIGLIDGLIEQLVKWLFRPVFDVFPGSSFLKNLDERWRKLIASGPPFQCWAIVGDRDALVSVDSLLSVPADHRLVVAGNHVSIVQPDSPNAPAVQLLRRALLNQPTPAEPVQAAKGMVALEEKRDAEEYDVFLYRESADGAEVREISEQLKKRGIRPWLAEELVPPGQSWKARLQEDIDRIGAVAVFIGEAGAERWDRKDSTDTIKEFASRGRPVIPVQLAKSPPYSVLPDRISDREPVDFRDVGSQPLDRLVDGIFGKLPKRPVPVGSPEKPPRDDGFRRRWPTRRYALVTVGALIVVAVVGWRAYEKWIGCGAETQTPITHHQGREIAHYVRRGNPARVLVFIHGIFGNAEDTWTAAPDTYWPDLVAGDGEFGRPDIYAAAYDTGLGNRMTMDEIAEGLYQRFRDDRVFTEHRQVVLVSHSLGGLVAQRLLLKHRDLGQQVPLIYFYATPQTGAQITKLGSIFSDDPLLAEMAPGSSNNYLTTMESDWRNAGFTAIRRLCAYEKLDVKCVRIVDEGSATRSCENAVALEKNHITIVKPSSTSDQAYILLRNAWHDLPNVP